MSTTITVTIIDDEKDGRDYIALLLANEFPMVEVTLQAPSVEEGYAMLKKQVPDILFLDIELGDGNAFQLLSRLNGTSSQIIFATAYEQYAINAIKNGAVDYLLKPIKKTEFVVAVKKALANIHNNRLLQSGQAAGVPEISLPTAHGFRKVAISGIVRCEADSNYTTIYLQDKTRIIVSQTLFEYEKHLSEHGFFRVHHKHLINLKHIREYIKLGGSRVVMADGSEIGVSVRKRSDFLKRYRG
jgi:two-component system LytT family response regulator